MSQVQRNASTCDSLLSQGQHKDGYINRKFIEEISEQIAGIDAGILPTQRQSGQIANRPMTNNGDVPYDGVLLLHLNGAGSQRSC